MANIKRLLLVDDEESIRMVTKDILIGEGYDVTVAPDGKAALDLMNLTTFDLIVSDVKMPYVTGIELLQSNMKGKAIPTILMTAFSELLEAHGAISLGAVGFLPKPFKKEELLGLIQQSLKVEKETKEDRGPPEQFCKIPIDDFVSGKRIAYCLYVKISELKYIKLANSGEDLTQERIVQFKQKGVHFLYLVKDDFCKYIGFNINLSKLANSSPLIAPEKRLKLIQHTGEILDQQLKNVGLKEETYQYSKAVVENVVTALSTDDAATGLLVLLAEGSNSLYAHSIGVSLLSVAIAKQIKWESSNNMFKAAMGGLLHDVGKLQIDPIVAAKTREEMNPEELKIWETHPAKGLEMIGGIRGVAGDVVQVAFQHHEDLLGNGFPQRLKGSHINPFARLVAVADAFYSLIGLEVKRGKILTGKEYLEKLDSLSDGRLDGEFLKALRRVFKL